MNPAKGHGKETVKEDRTPTRQELMEQLYDRYARG